MGASGNKTRDLQVLSDLLNDEDDYVQLNPG